MPFRVPENEYKTRYVRHGEHQLSGGVDHLSPTMTNQWLRGQSGVSREDRADAVGALESFGTADTIDTGEGGAQLPLFELRSIAPLGPNTNLTLGQATRNAVAILRVYQRIRQLGETRKIGRSVGFRRSRRSPVSGGGEAGALLWATTRLLGSRPANVTR